MGNVRFIVVNHDTSGELSLDGEFVALAMAPELVGFV